MQEKLPLRVGIVILMAAAVSFASNHVAARIAFDHGASVAAGVLSRASGTALLLLVMMRMQGIELAVPRGMRLPALGAGLLVAIQSYCLYSAVSMIPVALALLVFQTSPMLYMLITWAAGKEKPNWSSLGAMLVALAGLALALDIRTGHLAERWAQVGTGVLWACGAAVAYAFVYYINAYALKAMDGKLRTFAMTAVTATLALVLGWAMGALVAPRDGGGWLALALLTVFYCIAMTVTFSVLPRLASASGTVALNFEPIALLGLAWLLLGQAVNPLQIAGAFLTVGAIAWLGARR
jgi:drug/metabolite transporter (DMT)-like permease